MLKRLMMITAVLAMTLVMSTPTTISIGARVYTEGVHFEMLVRNAGTALKVTATKSVDGKWRQTMVDFLSFTGYETDLYGTAVLVEDPDGLEVSRDLGWGGLDGQITVPSKWGKENHLIEFHMWFPYSESSYIQEGATFKRSASIEGYILRDGQMWMDFRGPTATNVVESAYNFADQQPN
jgi:hypothetical protein